MATIQVSDDTFDKDVLKNDKSVLVDFYADWCGPCKMVAPILEEISDEMKDKLVIAKHNIDDNPNVPTRYGVRGIPTMLLFKDGKLVDTKVGAIPKKNIKEWLDSKI
ncbi:MAG: thioredoxin TrxA [Candidatus Fonsibacter sp.]|jgi:thioredoxin 1